MSKTIPRDFMDFSIDIESLGTRPGDVILSIGCVQFCRNTGKTGAEFYQEISLPTTLRSLDCDPRTVVWWLEGIASGDLSSEIFLKQDGKLPLAVVLDNFRGWLSNLCAGIPVIPNTLGSCREPLVWGNGATMDITLIEAAYRQGAHGLQPHWNFRGIRDMRTIVDAAEWVKSHTSKVPDEERAHHALDDARWQAKRIAECFAILKAGNKATATTIDEDEEL